MAIPECGGGWVGGEGGASDALLQKAGCLAVEEREPAVPALPQPTQ